MYSWGPDIAGTRYRHFAVGIDAVTLEGGREEGREGEEREGNQPRSSVNDTSGTQACMHTHTHITKSFYPIRE